MNCFKTLFAKETLVELIEQDASTLLSNWYTNRPIRLKNNLDYDFYWGCLNKNKVFMNKASLAWNHFVKTIDISYVVIWLKSTFSNM